MPTITINGCPYCNFNFWMETWTQGTNKCSKCGQEFFVEWKASGDLIASKENPYKDQAKEETTFVKELEHTINRYSQENGSNTPDFVLAEFLQDCLNAWNKACRRREEWYGVAHLPGGTQTPK
jgi:hypothetical protein